MKNETFCIISPKKAFLRELLRGMRLSDADQKMLAACVVKHVEISLKKKDRKSVV